MISPSSIKFVTLGKVFKLTPYERAAIGAIQAWGYQLHALLDLSYRCLQQSYSQKYDQGGSER